jgi:hypothetical protein
VTTFFHVSSVRNRSSIGEHGLDWTRMGAAPGIAGSARPEVEGVFLCEDEEVQWFMELNNTGGPVDLWKVTGVDIRELIDSPEGHQYVGRAIAPDHVELLEQDIPPRPHPDL